MPTFIENEIKEVLDDYIRNCIVVGEGRDYLIVLLTLKSKIDEKNEPLDELDDAVIMSLRSLDVNLTKPSEIANLDSNHKLMKYFKEKIAVACKRASISASYSTDICQVKNFKILSRDFSLQKGELNALMKVSRKKVLENFESEINDCYNSELSN